MKTIEEYLKQYQGKEIENISKGGSPAFLVDENLILVKYSSQNKYGLARESAEKVMQAVNSKNAKGINTPKHHAIHRVEIGENNHCLVLQEKAKGINLVEYSYSKNDIGTQYDLMKEFVSMPDSHIDKAILDICSLFNMGIELKEKNIFYDNSINDGGFIFIDFIAGDVKELDFTSIKDINFLTKFLGFLKAPCLPTWSNDYSDEEKLFSEQVFLTMHTRTFKSLERVIPNFIIYRRDILRSYNEKQLNNLRDSGVEFDNLNLTSDELFIFEEKCKNIVKESISDYLKGNIKISDIHINKIRLDLEYNFMFKNWEHNKSNTIKLENFNNNYEYEKESRCMLQDTLKMMFNTAVEINDYELKEVHFYDCYEKICDLKQQNENLKM